MEWADSLTRYAGLPAGELTFYLKTDIYFGGQNIELTVLLYARRKGNDQAGTLLGNLRENICTKPRPENNTGFRLFLTFFRTLGRAVQATDNSIRLLINRRKAG